MNLTTTIGACGSIAVLMCCFQSSITNAQLHSDVILCDMHDHMLQLAEAVCEHPDGSAAWLRTSALQTDRFPGNCGGIPFKWDHVDGQRSNCFYLTYLSRRFSRRDGGDLRCKVV